MELIYAVATWLTANWPAIEGLARNIAADLAALWVLGLALANVIKPFFPKTGDSIQSKLLGK